jgi:hypothetical protein
MVLHTKAHNVLEVGMVDVSVNSEKPLEDDFDCCAEVFGEHYSNLGREEVLVVKLVFDPCHKVVDVLGGADLQGRLNALTIGP